MDSSAKHGPGLDDQMKHEAQPVVQGAPKEPHGLLDVRSDLAAILAPTCFPATAEELARVAEEGYAPAKAVDALRRLPNDKQYQAFAQVWADLGGPVEHRGDSGEG